jgi:hypothetical protein
MRQVCSYISGYIVIPLSLMEGFTYPRANGRTQTENASRHYMRRTSVPRREKEREGRRKSFNEDLRNLHSSEDVIGQRFFLTLLLAIRITQIL